jgi:hypothetical protein
MSAPECINPGCKVVRLRHPVRTHPKTVPAIEIDLRWVCISCPGFPGHRGVRIHEDDLARLDVASRLGQTGTMEKFRLLPFPSIATLVGVAPIGTTPEKRIDSALRPAQLRPRLYNLLNFGSRRGWRRNYPHAVRCTAICHPVIIHTGLVDKICDVKPDESHYRFIGYLFQAIPNAVEGWLFDDGSGHPTYHLFALLQTNGTTHTMMIVVDAESHIVDTAYIIKENQENRYRRGQLLFATWGMP